MGVKRINAIRKLRLEELAELRAGERRKTNFSAIKKLSQNIKTYEAAAKASEKAGNKIRAIKLNQLAKYYRSEILRIKSAMRKERKRI